MRWPWTILLANVGTAIPPRNLSMSNVKYLLPISHQKRRMSDSAIERYPCLNTTVEKSNDTLDNRLVGENARKKGGATNRQPEPQKKRSNSLSSHDPTLRKIHMNSFMNKNPAPMFPIQLMVKQRSKKRTSYFRK